MIKGLIRYLANYLRLTAFAVGVLAGAQVPGMLSQYQTVVNAHLSEAKQNLAGFQATALKYFENDINRLIMHYRNSQDPVFINDADSIQAIVDRVAMLTAESNNLQQRPIFAALHMSKQFEEPLFQEALQAYHWAVPLTISALIWGFAFALVIMLCIDILYLGAKTLFFTQKSNPRVSRGARY